MAVSTTGGRSKSLFNSIDNKFKIDSIGKVFLSYKDIITKELTSRLNSLKKNEGTLIQSIDVDIVRDGGKITFLLKMNDYYKFVDEGVSGWKHKNNSQYSYKKNGKRIPLDAMKKFIAQRGLVPKVTAKAKAKNATLKNKKIKKAHKQIITKNKTKEIESFAWALGSKIKRDGIEPTYFFSDVINDELYLEIQNSIAEAIGKDIEIDFKVN